MIKQIRKYKQPYSIRRDFKRLGLRVNGAMLDVLVEREHNRQKHYKPSKSSQKYSSGKSREGFNLPYSPVSHFQYLPEERGFDCFPSYHPTLELNEYGFPIRYLPEYPNVYSCRGQYNEGVPRYG